MLANAKVCLYPRDPLEAIRVLREKGRQALILAGGTSAALVRDPEITTLVDLTRIGFDRIEATDSGLAIGCNVRLAALAAHAGVRALWGGMLAEASLAVGSCPIRNAATVGGNAVALFRWSDPPVAYLAMDARFELQGPEGVRTLPADELYARHPRSVLRPAEILLRVHLPAPAPRSGGAFVKLARTAVDFAVADCAVCLGLEPAGVRRARIVLGGLRTLPQRAPRAEALLIGKRPDPALFSEAAALAREEIPATDDVRNSREYKARMIEVLVARTLARAAAAGKEG